MKPSTSDYTSISCLSLKKNIKNCLFFKAGALLKAPDQNQGLACYCVVSIHL